MDVVDAIPAWQLVALAAIFGAMWGSFSNVVISRWPLGMSVLRPPSHCFSCKAPVRFYDNVPVLSYLVLRGRCRACGSSFSPRYPIVELVMALLSVGALGITLLASPPTFLQGVAEYFVWFSFAWGLVTAGFVDLDTYLLPDAILLPGIAVGLSANAFLLDLGWMEPLVAAAGGYASIRLLFIDGYRLVTGKPGMGHGDAKLVAMIGAFLGIRGTVFALFAGAVQGLVVGSVLVIRRRRGGAGAGEPIFEEEEEEGSPAEPDPRFRKAKIPFGPFLALGALEYVFAGGALIDLYTGGIARLFGLD